MLSINNKSSVKLKIAYETKDKIEEQDLTIPIEGEQTSWVNNFYTERIDSEEKILAYSQEQFDKKVISLRVFRYENDTTLTEIFAEKPFTDLSLWDIRFSHDDEMDLHHYWLNITDEIAKN
jgi:hypothetical protein